MRWLGAVCAVLGALIVAGGAQGQMIPLEDRRVNHARVIFLGITDSQTETPPVPFAHFNSFLNPFVQNPDPEGSGSSDATAFQDSEFFPGGINASGSTGGSWYAVPGTYDAVSLASFAFRVNTCVDYQLHAWLKEGDVPTTGEVVLQTHPPGVTYHDLTSGELHLSGRLSPGDYLIDGRSSFTTSAESVSGDTYAYFFTCLPCQNPLIIGQPIDRTVACDASSAVFSVTTSVPPAQLTFEWRRNGVPLVASAHVSGVSSPTLTIHDACTADIGAYDVRVSQATIVEHSRAARLDPNSTTDVEPAPLAAGVVSLEMAGPSPFRGATSFRYAASGTTEATIAIYDVSGAKVRTLADRVVAGTGVLTWDGKTGEGNRVPAGIYFVRIDAGTLHGSRKVVLLN